MNDEHRQHLQQLEREPAPPVIEPTCTTDEYGHCSTCNDEPRPARVLSVDHDTELALVAIGDTTGEVDIRLVDQVVPGVVLLIQGGVAIAKM
jgi:hypothetical protein